MRLKVSQNLSITCVALAAFLIAGCESSPPKSAEVKEEAVSKSSADIVVAETTTIEQKRWVLGEVANQHYQASCPSNTLYIPPEEISLYTAPINLRNVNAGEAASFDFLKSAELNGLEYVAGYHLTSDDPRFGGISGIETLDNGSLLSITDQGDFLWIGMDEYDHLQPVSAQISAIRDTNGTPYDSKRAADSEGLAVSNGLALVSFEQDHRIEAFDLETCGSNARASRILDLDLDKHGVEKISPNGGMEALALTGDGGLILGIETLIDGASQVSISPKGKMADFKHRLNAGGNKKMTGSDFLAQSDTEGDLYSLHRHYNPVTGTYIRLLQTHVQLDENDEYQLGEPKELLYLKPPGITDNFEGITVRREENGIIRLFIVSDDNFSPKQRSLFLIFNVEPKGY